jgi:hypothetical protein
MRDYNVKDERIIKKEKEYFILFYLPNSRDDTSGLIYFEIDDKNIKLVCATAYNQLFKCCARKASLGLRQTFPARYAGCFSLFPIFKLSHDYQEK